jgi:hypothetical protein
MRRLLILIASLMIAASATVAWALNDPAPDERRPAPVVGRVKREPLLIEGHVTGVFPGRTATMRVSVLNRSKQPLVMDRLTTDVAPASEACAASNLRVWPVRPRLPVLPHEEARLDVPVAMASDAADGCQDARFPLTFHARWEPR